MSKLREIPSVDSLANDPALAAFPEPIRIHAARLASSRLRDAIKTGNEPQDSAIVYALESAQQLTEASLGPAINLSGVVLHTGLGRARLSARAAQQVRRAAESHATLEFDLASGTRGDRQSHVAEALCSLTGADAALVVNNNAGAVHLVLAALSWGRDVLLSRGQMVEIGGSFRMPEVIASSGCAMVEVGCTNKTRLADYRKAATDNLGAILRCHPSNYRVIGFAEEPPTNELQGLATELGVPLIDDVGSGCLVDTAALGLPKEPTLSESIKLADVVTASGDKLLGGPQAGIVLGRRDLVEQCAKHPIARAVRADKLTLAGLEATLQHYLDGTWKEIPTWRYLTRSATEVRKLAAKLKRACSHPCELTASMSEIGSGSLPGAGIPTYCLRLPTAKPDTLLAKLRQNTPPVIGRIEAGAVLLDPRTLEESEIAIVAKALKDLT